MRTGSGRASWGCAGRCRASVISRTGARSFNAHLSRGGAGCRLAPRSCFGPLRLVAKPWQSRHRQISATRWSLMRRVPHAGQRNQGRDPRNRQGVHSTATLVRPLGQLRYAQLVSGSWVTAMRTPFETQTDHPSVAPSARRSAPTRRARAAPGRELDPAPLFEWYRMGEQDARVRWRHERAEDEGCDRARPPGCCREGGRPIRMISPPPAPGPRNFLRAGATSARSGG